MEGGEAGGGSNKIREKNQNVEFSRTETSSFNLSSLQSVFDKDSSTADPNIENDGKNNDHVDTKKDPLSKQGENEDLKLGKVETNEEEEDKEKGFNSKMKLHVSKSVKILLEHLNR